MGEENNTKTILEEERVLKKESGHLKNELNRVNSEKEKLFSDVKKYNEIQNQHSQSIR